MKNKDKKKKKQVVSTQDEAGLATGWVSPAARGSVGISRRGGGLWRVLQLLGLLLLRLRVVRGLCGSIQRQDRVCVVKPTEQLHCRCKGTTELERRALHVH